ncbi:5142_t:CDS:1 [Scutellospora calospora]|uniref:5142_t:CDS:1 n=1 Tax=Scutellospora calospora TaxID=85575 RepID=A0ACA9KFP4_9GLOM|nr:5142_t:CDS:1 [Scutellospora calospora]
MSSENGQPHKEWFQCLFHALHKDETSIEFPIDNCPPEDFIKIFNKNKEENFIKILGVISNIQHIVVWYWSKENEREIINRSIEYISDNFSLNENIESIDESERNKFYEVSEDNRDEEWQMHRKLIDELGETETIFPGFNYLLKYGWVPASNKGKTDLIITNGKGIFAIIDIKRNQNEDDKKFRMSFAVRQAGYYKHKFIEECGGIYNVNEDLSLDVIAVIGVAISEDNKGMCFRPFDEYVCEALDRIHGKDKSSHIYQLSDNDS